MRTSLLMAATATILLGTNAAHAQYRIAGHSFDVSERKLQWEYVGRATFGTSELTGAIWDAVDLSYEALAPDFTTWHVSEQLPAGANYMEIPLSSTESFIIATRTGRLVVSYGWYGSEESTLQEQNLIYARLNSSLLEFFCIRTRIAFGESGEFVPLLAWIYPMSTARRTHYFYGSEAYD